mmetsp:Transcript_11155/g.24580  ORF Transcript_11155/g.24580 Transcript_11155/m.24580 type:complete len:358 (-) Transcript_11155:65-1138(-)
MNLSDLPLLLRAHHLQLGPRRQQVLLLVGVEGDLRDIARVLSLDGQDGTVAAAPAGEPLGHVDIGGGTGNRPPGQQLTHLVLVIEIHGDTTPDLSGVPGKRAHSLEEQPQIGEVLLDLHSVLVTQGLVQIAINSIRRVQHDRSIQRTVHRLGGLPGLLAGQSLALLGGLVDLPLGRDAVRRLEQGLGAGLLHDAVDGGEGLVLLHLLEAHSQIELQKLFLLLELPGGVNGVGLLSPKVVGDQRVKFTGQQLQLVHVSPESIPDLPQHHFTFLDLLLGQAPQRDIITTVTLHILSLHKAVLALDLIKTVTVVPIIHGLGLEFGLEIGNSLRCGRKLLERILAVFPDAPPAVPGRERPI